MNNNDIKTAKDALPYRFVPVKGKSKKIKRVELNKYDKDLYSGKLFCNLYGVNPLILGNTHETEDINNPKSSTRIKPLIVDEKPVISSYTLKGAISNFLSAYIADPMTRVEKKGFLFRPNVDIPNKDDRRAGIKYDIAGGVITEINEDEGYIEVLKINGLPKFGCNSSNGYCIGTKGNPYSGIEVSKFENNRFKAGTKKKLQLYNNGPSEDFYFFDYPNGIDGEGKLLSKFFDFNTGPTNAKYHDYVMFQVKEVNKALKDGDYLFIDREELDTFNKTNRLLQTDHLSNHPYVDKLEIDNLKKEINKMKILDVGNILFFEYDVKNYKEEPYILTFGKTFYYPWAYTHELTKRWFPKDISYLDNEFDNDEISIIRDMFGYTLGKDDKELLDDNLIKDMNKNAKSGKVHFNYAKYQSGGQLQRNRHLPRPGSPKPNSYEFYLQQDGQHPLTTYGDPARKDYEGEVRLSGRKFYMKSELAGNNFRNNSDDYSIILDEVLIGKPDNTASKFNFTVNFENLTKTQLELLVGALNLNGNAEGYNSNTLYHQVGYGKNYGMGAVKISVKDGFVISLNGEKLNKESYDKENNSFGDIELKNLSIDNKLKDILKMYKTSFHYPKGGRTNDTIGWHSKLRIDDLKARRRENNE